MDTQTTWRNVLLLKPGAGGLLRGSTSCGAVLQVPTHLSPGNLLLCPKKINEHNNSPREGVSRNR